VSSIAKLLDKERSAGWQQTGMPRIEGLSLFLVSLEWEVQRLIKLVVHTFKRTNTVEEAILRLGKYQKNLQNFCRRQKNSARRYKKKKKPFSHEKILCEKKQQLLNAPPHCLKINMVHP